MSKQAVIEQLKLVLANSYALYLKTQNYHWNVTGPHFPQLHLLFEQQYTDLANAVDEIAERIRALGAKAPGAFGTYITLSQIADGDEDKSAHAMVADLANDQTTILTSLQKLFEYAGEVRDESSADLAIKRMEVHEKNRWMLQATSEK